MKLFTPAFRLGIAGLILGMQMACDKPSSPPSPSPTKQISELPFQQILLDDLSSFKETDGNWIIAESAQADRNEDKGPFKITSGTGILVIQSTAEKKSHLFTQMEHGDIDLEIDVMMPKGSNSGIYFQGRYEIQLFDSWGKETATSADMGGIYQRWDDGRGKGNERFEGHAPSVNASRAPGLWQHFSISFQAPRFDANGNKIASARFIRVALNGVEIHKDVPVNGPTRAAAFEDEKAMGPLMIQGDHGPVAIRNIRFKKYGQEQASFSDLTYSFYPIEIDEQNDNFFIDFPDAVATQTGSVDSISRYLSPENKNYILAFNGKINLPDSGKYLFEIKAAGGAVLLIDEELVIDFEGNNNYRTDAGIGEIALAAGPHTFEMKYLHNHHFWNQGLGLWVEGPGLKKQALHAPGSPAYIAPSPPILIEPTGEAIVHRSFLMHKGKKRTHVASVGDPSGVHYSYDLNEGAMLHAWRGPFLDATPMWRGRGADQLAVPTGAPIVLSGNPAVSPMGDVRAPWPTTLSDNPGFQFLGYRLDKAGRPTFRYSLNGAKWNDQIVPSEEGLTRTLTLTDHSNEALMWAQLAAGSSVKQLRKGVYAINDFEYFVEIIGPSIPEIRATKDGQALIALFTGTPTLTYSIIW